MRSFLDIILSFINSASLSDEEFDLCELTDLEYTKEVYDFLKSILVSREEISTQLERLASFFRAKGIDISEADANYEAKTNILIGRVL